MVTLYENIKQLCEQRGVTVSRMCLEIGVSKSTMSDLKSGKKKSMTIPTLEKIADYLGSTVDEVINGTWQGNMEREMRGYRMGRQAERERQEEIEKPATSNGDGLSDKDIRLLTWFRSLPEEKQKAILISQDAPTGLV